MTLFCQHFNTLSRPSHKNTKGFKNLPTFEISKQPLTCKIKQVMDDIHLDTFVIVCDRIDKILLNQKYPIKILTWLLF